MSDGLTDCARSAEYYARNYTKKHYPGLREFNPYHVPMRGEGFVIYETWLKHTVEIIKNHHVVKALEFTPFGKVKRLDLSSGRNKSSQSIAYGSGINANTRV